MSSTLGSLRREDLEDLLVEPAYFHALFHSQNRVQALYQTQTELETANEAIAREFHPAVVTCPTSDILPPQAIT